ncbi:MAG: AtpZ/AtpI family protein [Acetobacteraceae bacterium]|nr:AtpZ/AtpI family protein [Acetobacteraceae bacterium]
MSETPGGSDHPSEAETFVERLRAARVRQGLDQPVPEPGQGSEASGATALGIGLRVGVELVSALAVGVAIGLGLDRWLHMSPLFLILFLFLGGAAGVLNVWRVMAPNQPTGRR